MKIRLQINYMTARGYFFKEGSTYAVEPPDEGGRITLRCPLSGGAVIFGRSEYDLVKTSTKEAA